MEHHFLEFQENGTILRGAPKISEILVSLAEWFAVRKFNNFRIFWKLSLEISIPLEFWLNGKRHRIFDHMESALRLFENNATVYFLVVKACVTFHAA